MKKRMLWLAIIVGGIGFFLLSMSASYAQKPYAQDPMPSMTQMMTMTPMATGTHEPMPSMTPMTTMTPMMTGTHEPMPSMTPMMTMTPVMTGTHEPMPSMTPMMTMTPMPTGTHGPMPSMTPMMTMTPGPSATPGGNDQIAPEGTILINGGAETTTNPVVTLTLSATDDPGGTGVAWMYVREWGWDHDHGWHDMHRAGRHGGMGHMMGGWQPFASTAVWELSPEPGMKYITVWFADAAWNVGPPATAMIDLVTDDATINAGQVHQYRRHLQAGQTMSITVHPMGGDPDLYVWMPGNAGSPDWWSNASTGDDQVTFVAPAEEVYLVEVHGYSDAVYDLDMTVESGLEVASLSQSKPLPPAPLVADEPDTTDAPLPGSRLYLPVVFYRP